MKKGFEKVAGAIMMSSRTYIAGGGRGNANKPLAYMKCIGNFAAQQVAHKSSGKKGKSKGKSEDKVKPAVVRPPIILSSKEGLKAKLDSKGIRNFHVNGILQVEVDKLENVKFKIKVENRGSPAIDFKPNSSIDRGIFCNRSILGFKGSDPSFPAGKTTRPLHWSLKTKDESSIPIKIKCGTSVVGEHTKVQIVYEAFKLFDLENVQISVPVKAGKAEIQWPSIGRAWYDPGQSIEDSEVHWSLPIINDSNRYGSLEFLVPEAVDLSDFFPISVKFTAGSTFSNLKADILPLRKTVDPPKFVHHKELVAAKDDYQIVV